MHLFTLLLATALNLLAALAVPPSLPKRFLPHILRDQRPGRLGIGSASAITTAPITTTASNPWEDMCKPGAECDCSRIKDRNSDEFFQCVTNPRCEHCWVNITTTTTTKTTPPPTPVPRVVTDYQTLVPGTYTSSADGTAHIVVVQQPTQAPSTRIVISTLTVTATPSCPFPVSSSVVSASPSVTPCPDFCSCSHIEDKNSAGYFQCLTNPDCEDCRATSTSGTTSPTVTTTTSSPQSTATCPDYCDCSQIRDENSEEYFQCVTNPDCERCKFDRGSRK